MNQHAEPYHWYLNGVGTPFYNGLWDGFMATQIYTTMTLGSMTLGLQCPMLYALCSVLPGQQCSVLLGPRLYNDILQCHWGGESRTQHGLFVPFLHARREFARKVTDPITTSPERLGWLQCGYRQAGCLLVDG
jgi:hypothetical protein